MKKFLYFAFLLLTLLSVTNTWVNVPLTQG